MAEPIRIDSHVHLYRSGDEGSAEKRGYEVWEYGQKDGVRVSACSGTVDEVLEAMKSSGVAKAVVVNLFITREHRKAELAKLPTNLTGTQAAKAASDIEAMLIESHAAFDLWICEVARQHPEIVPFVGVDVATLPGDSGAAYVRDMVENHGAHGLKLHGSAQSFSMADERLWPMYAICEALGVPIIGHSGPDRDGAGMAEPRAFGRMLRAFPRLKVVLAHLGGATWGQALEIAETYRNAYFDCCEIVEWTGSTNGPSPQQLGRLIRDIGPERVMMGSDFPWYDIEHTVEQIMEMPVLSIEEKEGILGANAVKILDL
jgi:predicted TIM-barrel fold metal-dependent hydrolase